MATSSLIYRLKHTLWLRRMQDLRSLFLRLQGMSIGKGTRLGKVEINLPNVVAVEEGATLESQVYIQYAGSPANGFRIHIGARTFIGAFTHVNIQDQLSIGNDCMIASGCRIVDNEHGYTKLDVPMSKQPTTFEPIVIEDNVWLGTNVIVLKGVRIGTGAIVGAGAVVNHSIPANEIWAGVPARKIKDRPQ